MTTTVTRTEEIVIAATPETLWDYTQDYCRRWEWEGTVLIGRERDGRAEGEVEMRTLGGLRCTLQIALVDRPHRVAMSLVDIQSPWVIGGSSVWTYEATRGGTRWTQTNSLVVRAHLPPHLLRLLVVWQLGVGTHRAMKAAKARIEEATLPSGLVPPPRTESWERGAPVA